MVFYNFCYSFEVNIVAKHVNVKRKSIMAMGVLLHWIQANSFEFVVRQNHERLQGRRNRRNQERLSRDRSP